MMYQCKVGDQLSVDFDKNKISISEIQNFYIGTPLIGFRAPSYINRIQMLVTSEHQ